MNEKSYNYSKYKKRFEKKKVHFTDFNHVLIPVNLNKTHWVLLNVEPKYKRISYYDSLSSSSELPANNMMSILARFFEDHIESINPNNKNNNINSDVTIDKIDDETTNTNKEKSICSQISNIDDCSEIGESYCNGWKLGIKMCPKQQNLHDCGVFVCKFMDYICRGERMEFSQSDMQYFRTLIGIELVQGNLLTG